MEKKYIIRKDLIKKLQYYPFVYLYRIQAIRDFGNIKNGEMGGWVEREENLSQEGTCWIMGESEIYGNAKILDDARVFGKVKISDNALIYENATISDNALIGGNCKIHGKAHITNHVSLRGEIEVSGYYTEISGYTWITEMNFNGKLKIESGYIRGSHQKITPLRLIALNKNWELITADDAKIDVSL